MKCTPHLCTGGAVCTLHQCTGGAQKTTRFKYFESANFEPNWNTGWNFSKKSEPSQEFIWTMAFSKYLVTNLCQLLYCDLFLVIYYFVIYFLSFTILWFSSYLIYYLVIDSLCHLIFVIYFLYHLLSCDWFVMSLTILWIICHVIYYHVIYLLCHLLSCSNVCDDTSTWMVSLDGLQQAKLAIPVDK